MLPWSVPVSTILLYQITLRASLYFVNVPSGLHRGDENARKVACTSYVHFSYRVSLTSLTAADVSAIGREHTSIQDHDEVLCAAPDDGTVPMPPSPPSHRPGKAAGESGLLRLNKLSPRLYIGVSPRSERHLDKKKTFLALRPPFVALV